jgi:hypothetical protein
VTSDFFATLGIRPLRGRLFADADNEPGGSEGPVAVVSYRMWQQRLGGREDVGRDAPDDRSDAVHGHRVYNRPGFFGVEVGRAFDVAIRAASRRGLSRTPFDDDTTALTIMLRLKPGLSLAAAAAALQSVQPQIRAGAMPKLHPSGNSFRLRHTRGRRRGHVRARQQFERPPS